MQGGTAGQVNAAGVEPRGLRAVQGLRELSFLPPRAPAPCSATGRWGDPVRPYIKGPGLFWVLKIYSMF